MKDPATTTTTTNSTTASAGQECPAHVPFRPLDEFAPVEVTKRNLPHWEQEGACYFITFRLGDSLPQHLVQQLREERDDWKAENPEPHTKAQRDEFDKLFTERQQEWLDAGIWRLSSQKARNPGSRSNQPRKIRRDSL